MHCQKLVGFLNSGTFARIIVRGFSFLSRIRRHHATFSMLAFVRLWHEVSPLQRAGQHPDLSGERKAGEDGSRHASAAESH